MNFKFVGIGVIAVLLLCIGGLIGRATAPVRIEERVQVKTVEVEKVRTEWKDILITRTVYLKDTRKNLVKTEREVIRPDGTIEREKTEREVSSATEQGGEEAEQARTGVQEQSQETTQNVVAEKKIIPGPEWTVSVMVGAAPRAGFMPSIGPPPFAAGIHVQKKIVGPIVGGVWVLTNPSAGVSLGFQF
jgi:hypothetical protein